jgi:hypothetical protein
MIVVHGLRLDSRCFKVETSLGIREILDCLAPEISQLYCATHGDFLMYFSGGKSLSEVEIQSLQREYDRMLMEELDRVGNSIRELKLFQRGFLQRFRDYLYGDWNRFYLLEAEVPLSTIEPWSNKVPSGCQILICCVDAAYWEVFVESPALLARLKETFAAAIPWRLEDKTT